MSSGQEQILIVEDEMLVADDLTKQLDELGFGVAEYARNAEEAIRHTGNLRPDLVLMDIKLGGDRDGVTAAGVIRETWGIPVVFVTACASPAVLERAQTAEPYGFLTKPVDLHELQATLSIAMPEREPVPPASRGCGRGAEESR